ncbi:MAG: transglycosylase domain-containing protein, partial [Candidatus Dormibacteraeota bacterium]|nr:transglycosylase domain-containing protein [Candidatus Dormibacteraeota bacterium]
MPRWRGPRLRQPSTTDRWDGGESSALRRAAAVALVALSGLAAITLGWADSQMRALPDPGRGALIGRAVVVYDRNGRELGQRDPDGKYHLGLRLREMGRLAPSAMLAAEDRDFYRHGAINPASLVRALVVDLSSGSPVQGGSTITQQLVKLELLGSQKTAARKARELALAYSLEHRYSKDQILELYLNRVYYGHGAYGIGSATKTYFGSDRTAADLTPAQAAFLAGLPQAPSANDPFLHYGNARDRQLYVLRGMVTIGALTQAEEQKAEQEDISRELKLDLSYRQTIAPQFVNYVLANLESQLGAAAVHQGGLAVHTTLDVQLQGAAEQAVAAGVAKLAPFGVNNGMLLAVRPGTGEILAWVGSANYSQAEIGGQYDVITSPRQPGSSFKPYVYEAALISKKFTVDSPVNDLPMVINGYRPMDYDNRFQGQMCLKTALN